jgi:acetyltransferase-like isoleucine patch superfamily enzyme
LRINTFLKIRIILQKEDEMKIKPKIKRVIPKYVLEKYKMLYHGINFYFLNRIVSPLPSKHIRNMILRLMGAKIGKGVPIYCGCEFRCPSGLIIGKGSTIGHNCGIDARKGLIIGENVCIAAQVMIWTLHHDYNSIDFLAVGDRVEIGDFAWLASRCIVLPGVKIGKGAVIASGAVVTKDVEPFTVVGGVPAKKIGERKIQNYKYSPGEWWLPFI